ncbi:MAG: squalene synthase HpnC [Bacteroidota bacterium]
MTFETINSVQRTYTLDEAFAYCAEVTNTHYENFPVASFFLPAEKRPYMQSIYAFSRLADDMADEGPGSPEERLQALNGWEKQLQECYEGQTAHPVFVALNETVTKNGIPIELLKNLITAFKQDVTQNRYETFEQLLGYCACSANPVGRLVLMIFGYKDEEVYKFSDKICTALQLTNFWQDIAIDLRKDRLYIPAEDMHNSGYTTIDWRKETCDDSFRKLLKFQVDRTREIFYEGAPLINLLDRELELEIKLIWLGGMTILKQIEREQYDVFKHRPVLNLPQKFSVLAKGFWYNDLVHYKRKAKKPVWDLT